MTEHYECHTSKNGDYEYTIAFQDGIWFVDCWVLLGPYKGDCHWNKTYFPSQEGGADKAKEKALAEFNRWRD